METALDEATTADKIAQTIQIRTISIVSPANDQQVFPFKAERWNSRASPAHRNLSCGPEHSSDH